MEKNPKNEAAFNIIREGITTSSYKAETIKI